MPTSTQRPRLVIVAALARNRAIGRDNALLWRLPGDLKRFKQLTLGTPIVMGRKTFDSIGRPLPGRRNIVITRQPDWQADGVEVARSLDEAIERANTPAVPVIHIIGGAQIYEQALAIADEMALTRVDADFEADAWFPAWSDADFELLERSGVLVEHELPHEFLLYRRKPAPKAEPGGPPTSGTSTS